MISIRKILPAVGLIMAVFGMGMVVNAQDAPAKTAPEKTEKKQRMEGRGERFGKRGGHGMHRGGFGPMLRGLRQLDLTDAQKNQIKTLMETHRTTNQPLMEEMKTLMMKKRDGTITDADKARMEEMHTGMKASGDQLRATVLGLLTPEQNQKLEQMKAEREERMEMRKQRMLERKQQRKEQMLQKQKESTDPVVKQP
jgi:protein CpxP